MEIDWDDLLECFLGGDGDFEHYFDRDTGEVVSLSEEEEEDEDEEEEELRELIEDEPDRFVEVLPIDDSDRKECLEKFIASVKEKGLKELSSQLVHTLQIPNTFRAAERLLSSHPEEKRKWRQLQEKLAQEAIAAWIEENDIEADNPPPWKVKAHRKRPK
ncbi:MAG: hypothetical protein HY717_08115 [Planctomycetes bacterium]|nr:hypothetical protein [Planctomycetota bacterium]